VKLLATPPKRRSYTIKTRLYTIRSYERGASGKGLRALAKEYDISITLRGWLKKKDELEAALEADIRR
jgi:hypothetical protein